MCAKNVSRTRFRCGFCAVHKDASAISRRKQKDSRLCAQLVEQSSHTDSKQSPYVPETSTFHAISLSWLKLLVALFAEIA